MPYPIPPYLGQPTDTAGQYMQGMHIGSQIASEQARMQMEADRMQVEVAERQRQEQIQAQRQQQQLEMTKAYHDQQTQIRQEQLATMKQRVDLATQQAASRFAAQQQYQQAVAGGADPSQVLMQLGPQMGMTGAGMASLARPRGEPVWVPPDQQSGAPGYFKTPLGTVHIPPSAHTQGELTKRDLLNYYKSQLSALVKEGDYKEAITKSTTPARAQQIAGAKKQFEDVQAKVDALIKSGAAPKASGRARPLPKTKEELQEGVVYDTALGPATWDSHAQLFNPVSQ